MPFKHSPVTIDNGFDLERALQLGVQNERLDAAGDIGPIGDWDSEEAQRQYDCLYGTMDSPLSSAAGTPSQSRNPTPPPRRASPPAPAALRQVEDPSVAKRRPPKRRGRSGAPSVEDPSGVEQRPPKKRGRARAPSAPARATSPIAPGDEVDPSENSKTKRDKKKARSSRQKRRAKGAEKAAAGRMAGTAAVARHIRPAETLVADYSASSIPSSSSGFTAKPDGKGRVYGLKELLGRGMRLVQWDGSTPRPIVDSEGRVVALLAGHPRDKGWKEVHEAAFGLLRASHDRCRFSTSLMNHRRGLFAALNVGISFGLGQTAPGNLCHPPFRVAELDALIASPAFRRIACFASGAFAAWMPRLHAFYVEKFDSLLSHHKNLRRNYPRSVWAAAAFNFGPRTVTNKHRDFANLPFGICSVTALGQFDHTAGGHLVLWDLGLVVEFPAGSTVLLPSAAVAHSNTPVGSHDLRGSFAQYSAGGLFRWVEHGFQKDALFFKGYTDEEKAAAQVENAERGKLGLSLFSTYDELCQRPTANPGAGP